MSAKMGDRRSAGGPEELHVEQGVELADLIGQLRTELSRAMWAGEQSDIRFEPTAVQLELSVSVEKSAGANGKIRFWVVDASADAARSSSVLQRITLSLEPRLAGQPDRRPLIVGETLTDER
jgi:hypothetical protein